MHVLEQRGGAGCKAPPRMQSLDLPYSALFPRCLNFEVFADLVLPVKIAPSKLT